MTTKKSKKTKKQFSDKIKDNLEKKNMKLEEKIEHLKLELIEKEDLLLRSYADYQNYHKRKEKELQLNKTEIQKKYLSELIDIKELLNKAYTDKNPKKG